MQTKSLTEFFQRFMASLCLINDDYRNLHYVIEAAKSFPGHPVYHDPTLTRAQEFTLYTHRLRTASYWIVAAKSGLSFVPDFIRIPVLSNYVAQRKAQFDLYIRDLTQRTVDSIAKKKSRGIF
jgi:hypothetical protein